jgi:Family of unknown function (DUF6496)
MLVIVLLSQTDRNIRDPDPKALEPASGRVHGRVKISRAARSYRAAASACKHAGKLVNLYHPYARGVTVASTGDAWQRPGANFGMLIAYRTISKAHAEIDMPEKKTIERAKTAKRQGKAPSTQAGAFVKEQIDHVREGKHGVKSTKQAIAIGLAQARRAGVDIPAKKGATAASKPARAKDAQETGHAHAKTASSGNPTHAKRSRAALQALKREGSEPVSPQALSKQSRSAAGRRSPSDRAAAAKQAARAKGPAGRASAAKKAAHTRAVRGH